MFTDQHLIAEIGSVHDGSLGNALKLIDAAAYAGATVAKFQTHLAEAETLADAPSPSYFTGENRSDYFRRTGFTPAQWVTLAEQARRRGLLFVSSPFSEAAVALLEDVDVDAYKIASGEVTNLPLLQAVADTGRPVLLSSGMSSWGELDAAVEVLSKGAGQLAVMQCSSAYPCPPNQVGLNVLAEMRDRYGLPVGFSDHTNGPTAAIAAVVLGATIVEKHFTFSRLMYGSDAQFATEPAEWAALARWLTEAAAMRDSFVDKDDVAPYASMKQIFEHSVVTAVAVEPGTRLERHHLASKKPGTGIPAARLGDVVGRVVRCPLPVDHLIAEDDLA